MKTTKEDIMEEEEVYYYAEAWNGMLVRVPASKFDEWSARQEQLRRQGGPTEAEREQLRRQVRSALGHSE
ncbi:MAG: hypothetical protein KBS59_03115 [Clostridiales bacterium]|nr:hypothetical protein [Clostridiales bacterium]